jgi:deoxyribonuclease IV
LIEAKQAELGVTPIVTHAIYLTNLASDNPDLLRKSIDVLKYDLRFDSLVKGAGVVVHLGSHQGRGWEAVRDQVAQAITEILSDTPAQSKLLIENAAGQNGKVCGNLGEVRWLMDQVNSPRLGWCFDTCHGWAAGLALGTEKPQDNCMTAVEEIDRWHLWDELAVVHVNDSRDPFASGRDRHANLGDGEIPSQDLAYFLNYPKLPNIPLILEVPGIKDEGPDAENISRLKMLANQV